MGGNKKKGSIAVEAVFVVPLCLMVIFVLLESGLYLHHQSWYREAAWECILAGADTGEAEVLSHWEGLAANQILPVREVSAKVAKSDGRLDMTLQGGVSGVWGYTGMEFTVCVQREQIRPAEFVRRVHMLKKLGKGETR